MTMRSGGLLIKPGFRIRFVVKPASKNRRGGQAEALAGVP